MRKEPEEIFSKPGNQTLFKEKLPYKMEEVGSNYFFCPRTHLVMAASVMAFLVVTARGWGATGIQWVEARGATQTPYSAQDRPTTKSDSAQNINSAGTNELSRISKHCKVLLSALQNASPESLADFLK